jgi:hypothetical protein
MHLLTKLDDVPSAGPAQWLQAQEGPAPVAGFFLFIIVSNVLNRLFYDL